MEDNVEKLQNMTLKKVSLSLEKMDMKDLHALKEYLDDVYYNTGDSVLDDEKYDLIKETLKKRDSSYHPPVGAKLREGENRVNLPFWLGSLDKITPEEPEVLSRWRKDNRTDTYVISEKLDGVSCLLISKNGKISLYTRGDGSVGANISYLLPYFHTIPKDLPNIAVRGELILKRKVFDKKYKGKTVNGRSYKNPRNMVSGLIGGKTARQGLEDINFITYEIVADSPEKPEKQLKTLKKLGFSLVKYQVVDEIDIPYLSETLTEFREKSEYEIDGIIIQANQPYDRNTSGNPDYMFAFKMLMSDSVFETKVLSIEWNVSKWGQLKPVVLIEPVECNGVTMQRVTAHNAKYVEENNLGRGAVIRVTRSKEVIPYIVSVVKQAEKPDMPKEDYTWDENHVNISVNENMDIMCVKLIAGFFAKLGIKFVSEATVDKLFKGGLNNLLKIVGASKERLLQIFQEKTAERIYTNIHNGLQNIKLPTLLGASGVFGFGVGTRRMEALLLDIPDLFTVYKGKSRKELMTMVMNVEGFSEIMAEKVVDNLKYGDLFVQKMSKYMTVKSEERVSSGMKGHKYVMSGFRDKKLEEEITKRGGKVTGTVSKNTTGLILKNKSGKLTGKPLKAQELGVPIYTVEEFEKKLKKT